VRPKRTTAPTLIASLETGVSVLKNAAPSKTILLSIDDTLKEAQIAKTKAIEKTAEF